MEFIVGALLALGIGVFASVVGFDRERSFYPVVLIVVALYYDLFAVMGGSTPVLLSELAGTAVFVALSAVGFRVNLWFAVAGLVGHGIFDFFHAGLIEDPGVPHWWPMFCLAYDVTAGAYLAWRLSQRSVVSAQPARSK